MLDADLLCLLRFDRRRRVQERLARLRAVLARRKEKKKRGGQSAGMEGAHARARASWAHTHARL